MLSPVRRFAAAALLGAAGSALASRLFTRWPPAGAVTWTRRNYAGAPVSLLEGPAYGLGAGGACLAAGAPAGLPAAGATVLAGALGLLDDLAGDSGSKGLRGHLRQLARGRPTTGAAKVVGLVVTGALTAAAVERGAEPLDHPLAGAARSGGARGDSGRGRVRPQLEVLVGGAVLAGSANVVNLLDLRPGRALKAIVLGGLLLSTGRGASAAGAAVGAALGVLADDLAGRTMLGDTGANAAGALLGAALLAATGPSRPAAGAGGATRYSRRPTGGRQRLAALTALTALTLASEKVSFTSVIEATPGLRELDGWGRCA